MTDAPTAVHGTRDDLLWLAGLLEGEGTFDLQRGIYPRIRLAMTDRDIVGRAASLMDTGIRLQHRPAPASSTWHAEVQGPRAAAIMRELLPFMGARRSQRIADVLGVDVFRRTPGKRSMPGPALGRPLGVAKPATAA
ncbi:LAGLIDADG endonuclease [Microbacterium phage Cen1621]|uniref:LAGLIDADG endonuclease n=1 Tax=Microbacterium phage Cen1621 TaxID=2965191 RepID=A0A9E7QAV8_9CAUD|nr:LAGLIDADG endonuclease [Microbacterium phage Cen1621]